MQFGHEIIITLWIACISSVHQWYYHVWSCENFADTGKI